MRGLEEGGWVVLVICWWCGSLVSAFLLPFGQEKGFTEKVSLKVTSAVRDRGWNEAEGSGARTRRSADLPSALDLSFSLGERNVTLGLHRNLAMDALPPVYRVRGQELERLLLLNTKGAEGFYQDTTHGASFSVRHQEAGNEYYFTGSYFSGGDQFSLTPNVQLTSAIKSGDHDVSKVATDVDLNNDYLEFQAADLTSGMVGRVAGLLTEEDSSNSSNSRKKREAAVAAATTTTGTGNKFVVEMLLVVDYGVYELWLQRTKGPTEEARKQAAVERITEYYSFVLNGIDLRYASIQSNFTIDVSFAGIIIFDNPQDTYWSGGKLAVSTPRDMVEASDALEAFRTWALKLGPNLPPSDHVMLFTGFNLTYGGSVSNAGLAYLGSACNDDYYFSIVEEYFEFRTVAIAAHELGHSLGARHDMDGNTCLTFDRYIMTSRFRFSKARTAQNPWKFSSCSIEYFTDFLEDLSRNDTNCLLTTDAMTSNTEIKPYLVFQPGEVYAGDQFCQLSEGPESYICRSEHVDGYSEICYGGIQCYRSAHSDCDLKLPPDGLACGDRKWCENGTCVPSDLAPPAIDDACPFGDDVRWAVERLNCSQRVQGSPMQCYTPTFRARCCQSCAGAKRNLQGCEYGDRVAKCEPELCPMYTKEYARENCCETCSNLLYTPTTTAPTTSTTTATTTTTKPSTTTTMTSTTIITTTPPASSSLPVPVSLSETSPGNTSSAPETSTSTAAVLTSSSLVTSDAGAASLKVANVTESASTSTLGNENATIDVATALSSANDTAESVTDEGSISGTSHVTPTRTNNVTGETVTVFPTSNPQRPIPEVQLNQTTPTPPENSSDTTPSAGRIPTSSLSSSASNSTVTSDPFSTSPSSTSTTEEGEEMLSGSTTFDPLDWFQTDARWNWPGWISSSPGYPPTEEEEEGFYRGRGGGGRGLGERGSERGHRHFTTITSPPGLGSSTADLGFSSYDPSSSRGVGERSGKGQREGPDRPPRVGFTTLVPSVSTGGVDGRELYTGSNTLGLDKPATGSPGLDRERSRRNFGEEEEAEERPTVVRGWRDKGSHYLRHFRYYHPRGPYPEIFLTDPPAAAVTLDPHGRRGRHPPPYSHPENENGGVGRGEEEEEENEGGGQPTDLSQSADRGRLQGETTRTGHEGPSGRRSSNRGFSDGEQGGQGPEGRKFIWWLGEGRGNSHGGGAGTRSDRTGGAGPLDRGSREGQTSGEPQGRRHDPGQEASTGGNDANTAGRGQRPGEGGAGRGYPGTRRPTVPEHEESEGDISKDDDIHDEDKESSGIFLRHWRRQRASQQRLLNKAREQQVQRMRHLLLSIITQGVTSGQRLTALFDMLELLQSLRGFRILSSDLIPSNGLNNSRSNDASRIASASTSTSPPEIPASVSSSSTNSSIKITDSVAGVIDKNNDPSQHDLLVSKGLKSLSNDKSVEGSEKKTSSKSVLSQVDPNEIAKRKSLRMRLNRLFGSIVDSLFIDVASVEVGGGASRRRKRRSINELFDKNRAKRAIDHPVDLNARVLDHTKKLLIGELSEDDVKVLFRMKRDEVWARQDSAERSGWYSTTAAQVRTAHVGASASASHTGLSVDIASEPYQGDLRTRQNATKIVAAASGIRLVSENADGHNADKVGGGITDSGLLLNDPHAEPRMNTDLDHGSFDLDMDRRNSPLDSPGAITIKNANNIDAAMDVILINQSSEKAAANGSAYHDSENIVHTNDTGTPGVNTDISIDELANILESIEETLRTTEESADFVNSDNFEDSADSSLTDINKENNDEDEIDTAFSSENNKRRNSTTSMSNNEQNNKESNNNDSTEDILQDSAEQETGKAMSDDADDSKQTTVDLDDEILNEHPESDSAKRTESDRSDMHDSREISGNTEAPNSRESDTIPDSFNRLKTSQGQLDSQYLIDTKELTELSDNPDSHERHDNLAPLQSPENHDSAEGKVQLETANKTADDSDKEMLDHEDKADNSVTDETDHSDQILNDQSPDADSLERHQPKSPVSSQQPESREVSDLPEEPEYEHSVPNSPNSRATDLLNNPSTVDNSGSSEKAHRHDNRDVNRSYAPDNSDVESFREIQESRDLTALTEASKSLEVSDQPETFDKLDSRETPEDMYRHRLGSDEQDRQDANDSSDKSEANIPEQLDSSDTDKLHTNESIDNADSRESLDVTDAEDKDSERLSDVAGEPTTGVSARSPNAPEFGSTESQERLDESDLERSESLDTPGSPETVDAESRKGKDAQETPPKNTDSAGFDSSESPDRPDSLSQPVTTENQQAALSDNQDKRHSPDTADDDRTGREEYERPNAENSPVLVSPLTDSQETTENRRQITSIMPAKRRRPEVTDVERTSVSEPGITNRPVRERGDSGESEDKRQRTFRSQWRQTSDNNPHRATTPKRGRPNRDKDEPDGNDEHSEIIARRGDQESRSLHSSSSSSRNRGPPHNAATSELLHDTNNGIGKEDASEENVGDVANDESMHRHLGADILEERLEMFMNNIKEAESHRGEQETEPEADAYPSLLTQLSLVLREMSRVADQYHEDRKQDEIINDAGYVFFNSSAPAGFLPSSNLNSQVPDDGGSYHPTIDPFLARVVPLQEKSTASVNFEGRNMNASDRGPKDAGQPTVSHGLSNPSVTISSSEYHQQGAGTQPPSALDGTNKYLPELLLISSKVSDLSSTAIPVVSTNMDTPSLTFSSAAVPHNGPPEAMVQKVEVISTLTSHLHEEEQTVALNPVGSADQTVAKLAGYQQDSAAVAFAVGTARSQDPEHRVTSASQGSPP